MVIQKKLFITLFIFNLIFSFSINAALKKSVPNFIIMTEEYKPYNFIHNGVVEGLSVDLLLLILERAGSTQTKADIKVYPWKRAYRMIEENSDTLLFTMARTSERDNNFKWVGPIFEIEFFIYALKSRQIKINSYEDLRQYKIGTLRGDIVESLLVKYTGMKINEFSDATINLQNIMKLSKGRVDLVAESEDTLINTSKEAGLNSNDFESVFSLGKSNMYYAFHKDTPDSVIKLFQGTLDEIKKEKIFTEIFKKYGK